MGTVQNGDYISQYTGDQIDTLLGKTVWQSNPNLLDNWYFVGGGSQQGGGQFPINQRGQTSYAGLVYTIDRWYCNDGNVAIADDGIIITPNSHAIVEYMSASFAKPGETITFSVLGDENMRITIIGEGITRVDVAPENGLAVSTITLPENMSGLYGFWIISISDVGTKVKAAKLELGDHQTLAHQENGVWVLNEIPNYQEQLFRCQTSKADTADTYANKTNVVDNYYVRPNLLDNWYFVGGGSQQGGGQFPINQRGQTSYASPGYGIDRWKTTTGSISINSGDIEFPANTSADASTPNGGRIEQYLPVDMVIDKTMTISVLLSSNELFSATGVVTNENWSGFHVKLGNRGADIRVQNGGPFAVFFIDNLFGTEAVAVKAIKLELGDTQTLSHQENGVWVLNEIPNYQEQLARCQRYYYKSPIRSGADVFYPSIFTASVVDVNQGVPYFMLRCEVQFPVEMRARPVIKVNGSSDNETISLREQNSGRTLRGTFKCDSFCVNTMKLLRIYVDDYNYDGTITENLNQMFFEGYFEADANL